MNAKLLLSMMALHGDTRQSLAEYLGISLNSMCNKINEAGTQFKQGEISKLKDRYNLTPDQVDAIFFAD